MYNDAQTNQARQLLAQVRQKLDDLSDYQVEIAKARKELLVKRERLRAASQKIRVKRVEAGDAEAKLMNRLREFVNKYDDVLSLSLFEAYEAVSQIRDDLGEMEEDYLQAERDLTGEEWNYLDQEDSFYQFDIHGIVPESIDADYFPTQDQRPAAYLFGTSHPQHFYPETHPIQSFDSYISHGLPPPPPPPPHPPPVAFKPPVGSPNLPQRPYSTIAAEVDGLKRDFDQLREQQAQDIYWDESDEVLFEDGGDVPACESTPYTNGYLHILHEISTRETEALRLKMTGMDQYCEPATLTRRNSDIVRFPVDTLSRTRTMRRTKTESDASFTENDPATKAKILQWTLQYLENNAVEKRLYWKTLEQAGAPESVREDWKEKAEEYWGRDSMSEAGDVPERYMPAINIVDHAAELYDDEPSLKQSPISSSSMQEIRACENQHDGDMTRESMLVKTSSVPADDPLIISLPPSPISDCTPQNASETALPEISGSSDQNDHSEEPSEPQESVQNARTIQLTPPPCLAQVSDAAERKDSVICDPQKHTTAQKENTVLTKTTQPPPPSSNTEKPLPQSTATATNRIPDPPSSPHKITPTSASISGENTHMDALDIAREDSTPLLPSITESDLQYHKTSPRVQLPVRAVSERRAETMSRTRRVWSFLLRSGFKRRKSAG